MGLKLGINCAQHSLDQGVFSSQHPVVIPEFQERLMSVKTTSHFRSVAETADEHIQNELHCQDWRQICDIYTKDGIPTPTRLEIK